MPQLSGVRCLRGGAVVSPVGSESAGQGAAAVINDSKTVICHSRHASVQSDPGGHISRGNVMRGMPESAIMFWRES